MSPEKAAEIFKPFSTYATSNIRGNGVGLSICKKICEQMDGKIIVKSKKNEGSTFTFTMKAYLAKEEQKELIDEAQKLYEKNSHLEDIQEEHSEESELSQKEKEREL